MSEIRVNKVINEAGTGAVELTQGATLPSGKTISGAGGINVTGVITATTFSGNITGAAATFTGNVSIAGTLTYEDVTNVDSIGIITARSNLYVAGETRTTTISEKSVRIDGNTATLTYAGSSANVAICTNPSGDITLNVNSIPTDSTFDNHTLTFAVIVNSTGTARTCTAVNLNGVSKTIKWAGGSFTNALSGVTTSNGYIVQSFSGINTVGSASTTTNYEVFGIVSGGFF
jgi:hypothetical protein